MNSPKKLSLKFINWNLGTRIVFLVFISIITTALLIVATIIWQNQKLNQAVTKEVDAISQLDMDHIEKSIYTLIQTQNESIQQKVDENLSIANYMIEDLGGISIHPQTAAWAAVNQYDGSKKYISLQRMNVGDTWFGQNSDPAKNTIVLDELQKMVGGTATILQRMNEEGDFLRIATNLLNKEGERAIGSFIPAINPDGSSNLVVETVLKGETYRGFAYVVDAWYLTAYQPIMDDQGEIIGMIYVGEKQENFDTLRKAIMNIVIGKTGNAFILGGQGDDRGHYIISKNGEEDGINVIDLKDANGNAIIQEIVNSAIHLKPGETKTKRYLWQDADDQNPRWKVVTVGYYQPWDWVIGITAYEDELNQYQVQMKANQQNAIIFIGLVSTAIVLFGLFFAVQTAKGISNPLNNIVATIERIIQKDIATLSENIESLSTGDLTRDFTISNELLIVKSDDEVGQLSIAINELFTSLEDISKNYTHMTHHLREVMSTVAVNSAALASASTLLAESSQQAGETSAQISLTLHQVATGTADQSIMVAKSLSAVEQMQQAINGVAKGAQGQSESVNIVSNATNQINEAILQVAGNASAVITDSVSATKAAKNGTETVIQTLSGMQNIKRKVDISAQKIQEMGLKSEEIRKIIRVIDEIASQTNLLALNAAIEAARAGIQGKGFSVVADEVRKLAERSSIATKEIALLINGILTTVSEAEHAMDEGLHEVEKGVITANQAGAAIAEIMQAVEEVNKQANLAGEASNRMRLVSQQLVDAVDSVSVVVEENTASTEQMAAYSDEVVMAFESIASVSEQNNAAIEEVNAGTEEMSVQAAEVSKSTTWLAEMAQELQSIVNQFTVK